MERPTGVKECYRELMGGIGGPGRDWGAMGGGLQGY